MNSRRSRQMATGQEQTSSHRPETPAANGQRESFLDAVHGLHRTAGNRAVAALLGDGQRAEPHSDRTVQQAPGSPLDPGVRALMERRFGHDFRNVRVHTDAAAESAAQALEAQAFTIGRNIGFASGRYAPGTLAGRQLLAHELAHVAQQRPGAATRLQLPVSHQGDPQEQEADRAGERFQAGLPLHVTRGSAPPAIYRQPTGQGASPAGVDAETQVRQWLDQHQFAPPAQQPQEGEQHVLLNGQDMPLSDAVRLAVGETHQPEALVRRVIAAALGPSRILPGTLTGGPFIGPGNTVPGISTSLLRPTATGGIDPAIGKVIDLETIDRWLDDHHFYQPSVPDPRGAYAMLDGQRMTIEQIADRALAVVGGGGPTRVSFLTRQEVLVHIRQRFVAAPTGPTTQVILGYTLIPRALQAVAPAPDPQNPLRTQHQFSFTITRAHHASDKPGLESSFQGSVTLNDAGGIVNIQAGGQEAIVAPLLNGWIQVSGLVQLMASANWSRTATGSAAVSPAIQAAAGAQILVTPQATPLRLFNGRAALGVPQFGLQALGTAQASPAGPQVGGSVGVVINVPFSLP